MKKIFCLFLILFLLSSALLANPFAAKKTKNTVATPIGSRFLPKSFIAIQNDLKSNLTQVFKSIKKQNNFASYFVLIFLSFLYGIFHAAGPGHRKTIIFSLFISKKAHFWEPTIAGMLMATLHAFTSVFLILFIYIFISRFKMGLVSEASQFLQVLTYAILALFISMLLIWKIYNLIKHKGHHHKYLMESNSLYSTIIISGLIPCPGATIIMIFAISLAMVWQGVLAVIAMSLGMGITISLAGYLAYFGKEAIFNAFKQQEEKIERLSNILEISGLLLILFITLYMILPYFF
ncbi:MAG: hypothetical protein KKA19_06580 [Candidatus Margulisbacteria bacterium]|nr:hypothetical protein [Candidatus Margulisiibacteriota bacterium]